MILIAEMQLQTVTGISKVHVLWPWLILRYQMCIEMMEVNIVCLILISVSMGPCWFLTRALAKLNLVKSLITRLANLPLILIQILNCGSAVPGKMSLKISTGSVGMTVLLRLGTFGPPKMVLLREPNSFIIISRAI